LPAGAILPAAAGTIPVRRSGEPVWKSPAADPIRMIAGPDGRCNRELDAAFWAGRRFQVGSQINRMGLRLHGDPVTTVSPPDRLSAPVAPGAIQCAGGQLIVLGVSCGTMGGYPHIGHVISADLDRLGQLRPGDAITFHQVTLEEARSIDRSQRTARRALLRRVATLVEDD
jgi:allophanate hydrolase subunit 2